MALCVLLLLLLLSMLLMKSTKHSDVFTILYEIFAAQCSVAVVFAIFILLWHTDTHTHTYTLLGIYV